MIEDWLKTLGREEEGLINQVQDTSVAEGEKKFAIKEIKINCVSAGEWLKKISEKGYRLNGDLSDVREDYEKEGRRFEVYCKFTNHLDNHLFWAREVPKKIREGTFNPIFAREF